MTLLFVLERPSEERFLCSASRFFFSLIIRAAANAMILILFSGAFKTGFSKLVFSRRAKQCAGRVVLRRLSERASLVRDFQGGLWASHVSAGLAKVG